MSHIENSHRGENEPEAHCEHSVSRPDGQTVEYLLDKEIQEIPISFLLTCEKGSHRTDRWDPDFTLSL